MISTSDLKRGAMMELDGQIVQIMSYEHQKIGRGSADGPAADDNGFAGEEAFLAFRTDAGEEHLAGIFLMEWMGHVK